jgi:hypothetical protein
VRFFCDGLQAGTVFLELHDANCVIAISRLCQLSESERHDVRLDERSESKRRILGELGEFAPSDEAGSELFAIK